MNIESVNLSSLVPSSTAIEGSSPPMADGNVVSEGFSGALVAQIGLLSAIKTGDALPVQVPDLSGMQDINGLQSVAGKPVGAVDMQNLAALVGNDLPPSYKTKDDVEHEATLVAVTDTLKYIALGTTTGEKTAAAEQNMKDVIAMAVPAEQSMKDKIEATIPAEQSRKEKVVVAIPAAQNMNDVIAMVVPAEQSIKHKAAVAVPVEQNMKDVVAMTVSTEQHAANVVAEAEQSMKDPGVPGQMSLKQANDKAEKKQVEGEAQLKGVENNLVTEALAAAILPPPAAIPAEQGAAVNNSVFADAIEKGVLLSFSKPSSGDEKQSQSLKEAPVEVLHGEVVFRQSDQDKPSFNLKYFENTGQAEKAGRVERQTISLEGERTLPRIGGADVAALNRSVADSKTDVPAITKPLSHPEWNKDLGERIVWMSSKAIPAAEIRLNPQHLGPISVRVNVADDQATVVFTAQHASTRDALEASIPKLREMMGAQQLNLVEVSVSQGSTSDQGRSQSQNYAQTADGQAQHGAGGAVVDGIDEVEQEIDSGRAVVSKGLLSIYA